MILRPQIVQEGIFQIINQIMLIKINTTPVIPCKIE